MFKKVLYESSLIFMNRVEAVMYIGVTCSQGFGVKKFKYYSNGNGKPLEGFKNYF